MSAIGPGDLVVCVNATPKAVWTEYLGGPYMPLRLGRHYRVCRLTTTPSGERGVELFGVSNAVPHRGWDINRFRKLNDGTDDAELIKRIRKCKPIKELQHV